MTEYKTIREAVENLVKKVLENEDALKFFDRREKTNQTLSSIRKLMLEAVGEDETNTTGSPRNNDYIDERNQVRAELRQKIERITK
jgi:hypothetical protein